MRKADGWWPRSTRPPAPPSAPGSPPRRSTGWPGGPGPPGAGSNFLNYHGFPAVVCTSPNSMIVHGIPRRRSSSRRGHHLDRLRAIIEGYHGDAAYTTGVGTSPGGDRLMEVTERSLYAGIDQLQPGNRLHEVGRAVQQVAESAGFSVVREYVGHAIGTAMHEEPRSPTTGRARRARPSGRHGLRHRADGQCRRAGDTAPGRRVSVVTADGRLSAHFEHTIAVTDEGRRCSPSSDRLPPAPWAAGDRATGGGAGGRTGVGLAIWPEGLD